MSTLRTRLRRLLAATQGAMFVEYSSLVLLVALAAIALLPQWSSRALEPGTRPTAQARGYIRAARR
jgi:hypothetical protein